MLQGAPRAFQQKARIPSRLTPFIGRQADLQTVLELLEDSSVRLITITGEGGVGKTALAFEIANRLQNSFRHRAAYIPLAKLTAADELLPAFAAALDIQPPPNGDFQAAVIDHLSGLDQLLVLDSFEHLLDRAVLLRDILLAAPRIKILVTSREKLNLEPETVYSLSGLPLPPSENLQLMLEADSVRLFLQRAHQVRPGFSLDNSNAAAVLRICRMVDGNPLGILLAASWIEHFSPSEIADEADRSLDFLTRDLRDIEPRHSRLRAVFESSFQRLDAAHKRIFRRLAVFSGGFDLIAAQVVAGTDLGSLIALVEKSLLSRDPLSARYELHGLLNQFAREELEAAGEAEAALAAHAAYYCDFVWQLEPRMISNLQSGALDEMQADLENIRQAWTRLVKLRDFEAARRMLPGLYAFCDMRSRFYEGEAIFRQAGEGLAPGPDTAPHTAWALALLSWIDMYFYFKRFESYEQITAQGQACLDYATSMSDPEGMATSLVLLGNLAEHQGNCQSAIQHYERAMQLWPDMDAFYWVNMRIGICYEADGQYNKALDAFLISLDRGRKTGEQVKTGWSLENIGDTLALQGKFGEAEGYLQEALSHFQAVGTSIGILWSSYSLSRAALSQGKLDRAREFARGAAALAHQVHSPSWIEKTDGFLQQLQPELAQVSEADKRPHNELLSGRELEVLRLLKSELSGPEIAQALVVSLNTVRFHTKNIYMKLGVNNRLEAIRRAKELGL